MTYFPLDLYQKPCTVNSDVQLRSNYSNVATIHVYKSWLSNTFQKHLESYYWYTEKVMQFYELWRIKQNQSLTKAMKNQFLELYEPIISLIH